MDAIAKSFFVLLAILGIGFVIFIHELGHFLFAKWAKVRVDVFSIGFGKPLWSKTVGETDYCIAMFPFGGYVAFQEHEDPEAPEEERGRAFESVSAGWRALILGSGVVFNLVASLLILLFLAWYGLPIHPPQVGQVQPRLVDQHGDVVASPAMELGMRMGDHVLSVNGRSIKAFEHIQLSVIDTGTAPVHVSVRRDGTVTRLPAEGPGVPPVYDPAVGRPRLGLVPAVATRVTAIAGSDAIPVGADVVAVDGQEAGDMPAQMLQEELLLPRLGAEPVPLTVAHNGTRETVAIAYAGDPAEGGGLWASALGLPVQISGVIDDMPAAAAGLRPGDFVHSVGGQTVASTMHLRALIRRALDADPEATVAMSYWRADATGGWTTHQAAVPAKRDPASGQLLIGIQLSQRRQGVLPYLVPGLRQSESALREAGLAAGDVLLAVHVDDAGEARLRYLRGGQRVLVALDKSAWKVLDDAHEPSALAKIFFARPTTPVTLRLLGARVIELTPEAVVVERHGGYDGDWIASAFARDGDGDGERALEIVRGNTAEQPHRAQVALPDPGVAIGFNEYRMVDYPLDAWYEGFGVAWNESQRILGTTFRLIPKFFQPAEEGGVDASKSLQGPIGIFRTLRSGVETAGIAGFLRLLAILGLNLFLINLLPLPVADGGRLLFLGIETIIRRPLPPRLLDVVNAVGVALILALMLYVVGLDLLRSFELH
ncbi:MAG: site-2 protease family protein [Planctomycetota bacterium]